MRQCPEGMRDGCTGAITTVHACVASDAAAGPACSVEVSRQCPEGQVDACSLTPAIATAHVCVLR